MTVFYEFVLKINHWLLKCYDCYFFISNAMEIHSYVSSAYQPSTMPMFTCLLWQFNCLMVSYPQIFISKNNTLGVGNLRLVYNNVVVTNNPFALCC